MSQGKNRDSRFILLPFTPKWGIPRVGPGERKFRENAKIFIRPGLEFDKVKKSDELVL